MAFTSVKISSQKLDAVIRRQNRSVSMVAEQLDVSLGTMWRWLKGPVAGVDPRRFHKMLEVFGMKPEELKADAQTSKTIALRIPPDLHADLLAAARDEGFTDLIAFLRERVAVAREQIIEPPAAGADGAPAVRAARKSPRPAKVAGSSRRRSKVPRRSPS